MSKCKMIVTLGLGFGLIAGPPQRLPLAIWLMCNGIGFTYPA